MEAQLRKTDLMRKMSKKVEEHHAAGTRGGLFSAWNGASEAQSTLDRRIYSMMLNKEGREQSRRILKSKQNTSSTVGPASFVGS